MKLDVAVRGAVSYYTQELYYLQQFIHDINSFITTDVLKKENLFKDASVDDIKQSKELWEETNGFFSQSIKQIDKSSIRKGKIEIIFKPQKTYSEKAQRILANLFILVYKPFRYPYFLFNMGLVYAISLFESFLSDFLVAIFTNRPTKLKSTNQISYIDVLSSTSIKKLTEKLSSTTVDKIMDENIDKVKVELEKIFNIDISKFSGFQQLRESCYRRNVVIHNNGNVDKKYFQNVPGSKIGNKLKTDLNYINDLFDVMGRFIDFVDRTFSLKMKYTRDTSANKLLNPPRTF